MLTTSSYHHQQLESAKDVHAEAPKYDAEELLGIINPDIRLPTDMLEVLLRIVDGSKLEQFKRQYGKGMLCAWARIHGTHFTFSSLDARH